LRYQLVIWFKAHYQIDFYMIPEDVRNLIISYFDVHSFVNFAATNTANLAYSRSAEAFPLWRRHYRASFVVYPNLPVLRSVDLLTDDACRDYQIKLFFVPLYKDARRVIDEEAVTRFCEGRNWRDFFIDATMRERKDAKLRLVQVHLPSTAQRMKLDALVQKSLPPRLAMVRDYQPLDLKYEPFPPESERGEEPEVLPSPNRRTRYDYDDRVLESEVGEFFE
jgi:hypothetical protein